MRKLQDRGLWALVGVTALMTLLVAAPAAAKTKQVTDGRSLWHVHKGGWSPDNKTIVYTRDADQGDIYTIENYR